MVKLSIIIPYYQTYEFTKLLLEKLEPQLTDEVEVLLEDDGCYETRLDKFKKIIITHKENEGVAPTRNGAIKKAKGEYIAFIDSDDMIADNYVEVLLDAIEKYNNSKCTRLLVISQTTYSMDKFEHIIEKLKIYLINSWKSIIHFY